MNLPKGVIHMENTPFIHIENLSYAYVGEDE